MIIVGVDVETTGLDSNNDEIVEIGVVLFDVDSLRVISVYGKVFKVNKWGEEAAECHQIPIEISNIMPHIDEGFLDPWEIISGDLADYVVAHNAPHDHAFVTKIWPSFLKKPWLCTQRDLNHNQFIKKVSSHRLAHLCVDYHISMGSWHQAVADAEACARIAAKHDLNKAYEYKMIPKYRFITYGKFLENGKEIIESMPSVLTGGSKYRWNTEDAPKAWSKDGLTIEELELDAKHIKTETKGLWKFEGVPLPPKTY